MKKELNSYLLDDLKPSPKIVLPGEGSRLSIKDSKVTMKITSEMTENQFGVYHIELGPGEVGANLHYHRFMEELFFVVSGNLTLTMKETQRVLPPGTTVHIPRFSVHGFQNDSKETVNALLFFNPSMGREGFFEGLKLVMDQKPFNPNLFETLYNKYDSIPYVNPTAGE